MADYVLKEVIVEGQTTENNEKIFETPNGNQYKVRIEGAPGSINVSVSRLDETYSIITTDSIPLMGDMNMKNQIEQRLSEALRRADTQEEARKSAKAYLETSWGIDIDSPVTQPAMPVVAETPVVKFLNKRGTENTPKEG